MAHTCDAGIDNTQQRQIHESMRTEETTRRMVLGTTGSFTKKTVMGPYLTAHSKLHYRWVKDPDVNGKAKVNTGKHMMVKFGT